MDKSKINQSSIELEAGSLKAYVNINTGRALIFFNICNVGLNSFNIELNNVYNSTLKQLNINGSKLFLSDKYSHNWAWSVFKYQSSYNFDGFSTNDYVLIDGETNIHKFVKYCSKIENSITYDYYYDSEGTGLKLKVSNSEAILFDRTDNIYTFENSRLTSIQSSYNSDIFKKFIYSDNKLVEIYDNRKSSRKIRLYYHENLLVKVNDGICDYNYSYDNNNLLVEVSKSVGFNKKVLYKMTYNDNNLLESIYDNYANLGFSIQYYNGKVDIINTFEGKFVSGCYDPVYIGDNVYVGDLLFLEEDDLLDYGHTLGNGKLLSYKQFVYGNYSTIISDEAGITKEIFFDKDDNVISEFEKYSNSSYSTLNPITGISLLSAESTSGVAINGKRAIRVENKNFIVDSNDIYYMLANRNLLLGEDEYESTEINYQISFYLNYNDSINNDLKVYIEHNNRTRVSPIVSAKRCNSNAWQLVTIPVNFKTDIYNVLAIELVFETNAEIINIANVMIERRTTSEVYIDNHNLSDYDQIIYNNGTENLVINLEDNFVLSADDVTETYKNMLKADLADEDCFELVMNNSKQIVFARTVQLTNSKDSSINAYLTYSGSKIYTPNFYLLTKEFKNRVYMINKTNYGYVINQINGKLEYIINKYVWTNLSDFASLNTSSAIKYEQRVDEYGNVLYEKDPFNLVVSKTYDNYGNLVKTVNSSALSTSSESMTSEEIYDSSHEFVKVKISDGVSTYYQYDENGYLLSYIVGNTLFELAYNDYKDQIISITITNNNNASESVTYYVNYDINDRVQKMYNSIDTHEFFYDEYGKLKSYKRNDDYREDYEEKLRTNINVNNEIILPNGSKRVKKIFNNKNSSSDKSEYYDKYGRLRYLKANYLDSNNNEQEGIVEVAYEDLNQEYEGSISSARVTLITDSFGKRRYDFYNDDESVSSEIYVGKDENQKGAYHINIYSKLHKEVYFNDAHHTRRILFIQDASGKTISSIDRNIDFSQTSTPFDYFYEYDEFGRLTKSERIRLVENTRALSKKYLYKNNTNLPREMILNLESNSSTALIKESVTYDSLNNISSVNETILGNDSRNFTYDGFNQVVSENHNGNITEYIYDNYGNLIKIKYNGEEIKQFEYDKGRLVGVRDYDDEYNLTYDNYGNVISYGNYRYVYDLRNKLSKVVNTQNGLDFEILFEYNYKGERTRKVLKYAGVILKNIIYFYDDESKLLGEDWYDSNNNSLAVIRYYYNLEGICGIRYNDNILHLIRDSLGNIRWVSDGVNILAEYEYDAWGNHSINVLGELSSIESDMINNNPFRYKGYYYDVETQLFYCNSRYYSPELCRWISPDSIEYLDPQSINGLNLYCYCYNNPILYSDPSGHMPKWLKNVIDIGLYVVSAAISIAVGIAVSNVATPAAGIAAGIAVFGALNNLTNTIYYNFISDGESDLTSSSYRNGYINRWDRLDYVKQQTGQDTFNTTAWMYFSEYNLHMYGWYLTGWAHEKNVPLISDLAERTHSAEINVGKWDSRWYFNVGIVILGLLGL